jgi:hypothetical protein
MLGDGQQAGLDGATVICQGFMPNELKSFKQDWRCVSVSTSVLNAGE